MNSIADQVRAYMDWRSDRDGEPWNEAKMATAVAARQRADESPCKRQDIENLLKKDIRAPRYLVALAAAMGTTAEVLKAGRFQPGKTRSGANNVEPGPDLRGKVPLISWVQAGDWNPAADPNYPGEAEAWMDCPVRHSPSTFALRVRGDSMTAPHGNTRTYPEGSVIFVDPERRRPANGDRIIACLEDTDEVTFKVYKNEDGRQWLQPLNPAHEPIREPFKVLGTVLGKWEDG